MNIIKIQKMTDCLQDGRMHDIMQHIRICNNTNTIKKICEIFKVICNMSSHTVNH